MEDVILLKEMPFDKAFDVNGKSELCKATGYAVRFNNEQTPVGLPLYWNEYVDSNGDLHYGN